MNLLSESAAQSSYNPQANIFVEKQENTQAGNVSRNGLARLMRRFPVLLLIALAVFALAWVVQLVRQPLKVDVGATNALDNIYLDEGSHIDDSTGEDKGYGGFFAPEQQPQAQPNSDASYRWSERTSYLKLHWPEDATPVTVTLRLSAPRPNLPPDQVGAHIKVTSIIGRDENLLGQFDVTGLPQSYSFVIPTHLAPDLSQMRLRLDANSDFQPGKGDSRQLSFIFYSFSVQPDYATFGWKGWFASFLRPALLAIIAFFCGAIAQLTFSRRHWAWLCEVVAGALLLLSMLVWATQAEPYYSAWAFVLPLAWCLVWTAKTFAKRIENLPSPFVYAATLYLLMPIIQFALGRLDLYSINPASVTFEAYLGALLFCAGMYVRYFLLGQPQTTSFEQTFVRAMLFAAVVSFVYNQVFIWQTDLYRGADFKVYYYALRDYEAGKPLYDLNAVLNHPGDAVRVPPTFGILVWPFVRIFTFNVELAVSFWRALNELLVIPTIWVLIKVFGGTQQGKYFTAAVVFLCLSFGQISDTIAYGQFNVIMLFGLGLAALWIKQKRDLLSGIALALPVGIKIVPILWTPFWLVRRRWQGLVGLVLGGAIIAVLSSLVVGWNNIWIYVSQIVFGVNHPEITITNQALFGFLGRLSVPQVMDDYKGTLAGWVTFLGYGGALVFTLVNIIVLWRSCKNKDVWQTLLEISSLNLLMLFIPPFVWFHYATLGLVSILTLLVVLTLQNSSRDRNAPTWQLLLFGLAYVMLAYGGRNDFFFTEAVGLARLGSSYRFVAVVALWLLNLWYLWRNRAANQLESEFENQPAQIGEQNATR